MNRMNSLSRRERQIVDALFQLGEGDAESVRAQLDDAPGYDSVRTLLRILETKGHVLKTQRGRRYVYRPALDRATALKGAWRNLVETFFAGSHERASATLLGATDAELNSEKLAELLVSFDAARKTSDE